MKKLELWDDAHLVDETNDGYKLVIGDGTSNIANKVFYKYTMYGPDNTLAHCWFQEEDALSLPISQYKTSEIRKKFLKYVNIDRAEREADDTIYDIDDVISKPKKVNNSSCSHATDLYDSSHSSYNTHSYYSRWRDSYEPEPEVLDQEKFDKYNKSKTLCLHKSDSTTTMLAQIYEGKDWDVINDCWSVNHTTLHALIDSHERIVMLGHGTSWGLIGFIRDCCAEHLKGKKLFMLWCNADSYWAKHKELGTGWYCTGNMPSDEHEAASVGCNVTHEWMDENITYWCKLCADVVEQCLEGDAKEGAKYIRDKYWEKYKDSEEVDQRKITLYNYQRTKVSGDPLINIPEDANPEDLK